MIQNEKLLKKLAASGNQMLLYESAARYGWTDEDTSRAYREVIVNEVLPIMEQRGEVYTADEIEEFLGDDGYEY